MDAVHYGEQNLSSHCGMRAFEWEKKI